jgi:hypothetical protein
MDCCCRLVRAALLVPKRTEVASKVPLMLNEPDHAPAPRLPRRRRLARHRTPLIKRPTPRTSSP